MIRMILVVCRAAATSQDSRYGVPTSHAIAASGSSYYILDQVAEEACRWVVNFMSNRSSLAIQWTGDVKPGRQVTPRCCTPTGNLTYLR